MTRISKQEERRHVSFRKHKKNLSKKTGSLKDKLTLGYKEHTNTISKGNSFIPKIK